MATVPPLRAPAPRLVTGRPHRPAARQLARAVLMLTRPGQWPKNLLVLAAPAAGGVLLQPQALQRSFLAAVAFVAASAAVYALNDVLDVEADRRHPLKRRRPVASGALSVGAALAVAVTAAAGAVAVAAALSRPTLAIVVGYLLLSVAYATRLKHVAVVTINSAWK